MAIDLGMREWAAGEWMAGTLGAVGLGHRARRLRRLHERFSAAYARPLLLLGSGTTALVLALRAIRSRSPRGNSVLLPALACPALTAAVHLAGLQPRYVDIGEDLNVSPLALSSAVDSDTVAFVMVHAYGLPADSDATEAVCSKLGLSLIDDAAQRVDPAEGLGTRGQFGVLSFAQSKSVACGIGTAGGVLLVNDESLLVEVRRAAEALAPPAGRPFAWLEFALPQRARRLGHAMARWNESMGWRSTKALVSMGTLEAGIAYHQLKTLAARSQRRRLQLDWYRKHLHSVGFEAPQLRGAGSPYLTRLMVYVPEHLRDGCRVELQKKGIATRLPYPLPPGVTPATHPTAHRASSALIELPMPAGMREDDVVSVVGALADALVPRRP